MSRKYLCSWLLALILTACGVTPNSTLVPATITAPTAVPTPALTTAGIVQHIGQAPHRPAPSFNRESIGHFYAWTGVQDQLARLFVGHLDTPPTALDLIAYYPQDLQLIATQSGHLLFWLDRRDEADNLRLQVAVLDDEGTLTSSAVPIANQRTRHYDAITLSARDVRAVWSGGTGEVTDLYLHQVDNLGRPVGGDRLRIGGDYPALIRDNADNVHLFWLEDNGRAVYQARFDEIGNPRLQAVQAISRLNLDVTDSILHFDAVFDGELVYLLWHVRRLDDTQRVLMSYGSLDAERFSPPEALIIDGQTVRWASASQTIESPLPIVTHDGTSLALTWLAEGAITQVETLAQTAPVIGRPQIISDEAQYTIGWAQATTNIYADLWALQRPR
ncbi:MAG: hypothetical protein ACFE0Q_12130 [Anaerolineae bacterium]